MRMRWEVQELKERIMKTLNYCTLAHYTQICGCGLMSKRFTGLPYPHRIIRLKMLTVKTVITSNLCTMFFISA